MLTISLVLMQYTLVGPSQGGISRIAVYNPDYLSQVYFISGTAKPISVGYYHSCAVLETGKVKYWGYNGTGQLGDGTTANAYTLVEVAGI